MKSFSIVMPYYMNPNMLAHHYDHWATFPKGVKDRIKVVIVDDGSPKEEEAVSVPFIPNLPDVKIYRIHKDIPWNQHGARNLGAHVAETQWLLMTDMDHLVPLKTAEYILSLKNRNVYTFDRYDAHTMLQTLDKQGRPKPHVNSFLVRKDAYWQVGGYDEDYCGHYGTDGLFRARMFGMFKKVALKNVPLIRYGREAIADASTRTIERRPTGSVKGKQKEIRNWKVANGRADIICTLNFKWSYAKGNNDERTQRPEGSVHTEVKDSS